MGMRYKVYAAAMPTTAALAAIATGTSLKTLLQFKPGIPCRVVDWGVSFDGIGTAATPGKIELIETDVAATVTAFVNNDLHKMNLEAVRHGDPTSGVALISVGTTASGYNASGEGSITASRLFDAQYGSPNGSYGRQMPLGREFEVDTNKFLRIRVHFGTTVNAFPWLEVEF